MVRNTDDVLLSKEEYNELLEDSHSLQMIFNWIEGNSYIDLDGNFCVDMNENFMKIFQMIDSERIDEIEEKKRKAFEKFEEQAEKVVLEVEKETPQQEQENEEEY